MRIAFKFMGGIFLASIAFQSSWADEALAKGKNCLACHSVDKKVIGPAFKDVAAKYAGDKAAAGKLAEKIRKGGSGSFGATPMPANPQVNEAESKKLAEWVLSTGKPAPAAASKPEPQKVK